MGNTHFFYALKLPDITKELIHEKVQKIRNDFPFSRWVHVQDYHITLAFLGSASNEKLQASRTNVRLALKTENKFPICINGIGVFGSPTSPRIFWAKVEKQPRLFEVQEKVYDACTLAGFKLEKRPFHPHITLGRKWKGEQPMETDSLETLNPFMTEEMPFSGTEIVLYQTYLDREPKYEIVECFQLEHSEVER